MPPPQTQWHSGQINERAPQIENTTIALNFIRSAKAPQMSAGVMMKNMPWNSMCVSRGMCSRHRLDHRVGRGASH